ncbi:MAG: hypothetical protein OXU21_00990 [Chloroflexota bacterium]|nr:hypothetical protein [Chloroflexota bacterium]
MYKNPRPQVDPRHGGGIGPTVTDGRWALHVLTDELGVVDLRDPA